MTTATFNLRALVREVLESSSLTDPGALAKEVSRNVPDEYVRDAFEEMLRTYVQKVITADRSFTPTPPTYHEVPAPRPAGKTRPSAKSQKVKAVREWWRGVLRERVHIGPDASDWKFLADCTVDDLVFAEDARRALAARNIANADQLKGLRELLAEHGVEHVRDLADDVLAAYFGGGK